eukprot:CAMPEP_0180429110 /NCGR_PEP_ID=MMETSP1036_2-20121128/7187_1 /TAXON_ID=632150 /ORGANISM="Azadinium spinosum, Strain 3D9" /LENGTH=258 /DNA_ID=CAMNT_0022434775 /DNA_START=6 /DNA_END=778 /DNA_ORIENTATION=-
MGNATVAECCKKCDEENALWDSAQVYRTNIFNAAGDPEEEDTAWRHWRQPQACTWPPRPDSSAAVGESAVSGVKQPHKTVSPTPEERATPVVAVAEATERSVGQADFHFPQLYEVSDDPLPAPSPERLNSEDTDDGTTPVVDEEGTLSTTPTLARASLTPRKVTRFILDAVEEGEESSQCDVPLESKPIGSRGILASRERSAGSQGPPRVIPGHERAQLVEENFEEERQAPMPLEPAAAAWIRSERSASLAFEETATP